MTQRLVAAATATFHTNQHVLAMIRPGTRAELQECLRIASRMPVTQSAPEELGLWLARAVQRWLCAAA